MRRTGDSRPPPGEEAGIALRAAAVVLGFLAAAKLTDEFRRLLFGTPEDLGAVDLVRRWRETVAWFAGEPVYAMDDAIYPPATYPVLWPITGWLSFEGARWAWAVVYAGLLAWFAVFCARESGARTREGRIVAGLLPLAFNSTGATIGNGQLLLFSLPPILVACLRLARRAPSAGGDAVAALLFCVAMVKPSATAPFAFIFLSMPRRLRPAVLAAAAYLALTAFALLFQPLDLSVLRGTNVHESATRIIGASYGSLQSALVHAGFVDSPLMVLLPVLALLGFGLWAHLRRDADPWLLMAVAALVARMGWYHRVYDDLLTLVAVMALLRCAAGRIGGATDDGSRAAVARLLAVGVTAVAILPARSHVGNWWGVARSVNVVTVGLWLASLLFLAREAAREHRVQSQG